MLVCTFRYRTAAHLHFMEAAAAQLDVRATREGIERVHRRAVIRWCLLPVAAIGSCSATGMASLGVARWLEMRFGAPAVELALPLDARDAIRYFFEAFAFVCAGTLMAPRARASVSLALLAIGAWLAWEVLAWWYFPEFHPRGYEVSRMPLWGTWLGGVSAVSALGLPSARRALTAVGADGRLG